VFVDFRTRFTDTITKRAPRRRPQNLGKRRKEFPVVMQSEPRVARYWYVARFALLEIEALYG